MARSRSAHFDITGRFDNASKAKVTIETVGQTVLVKVRPHHARREYIMPLSTLAEILIWKVVKAEVQEKER